MWSKREIVAQAFEQVGLAAYVFDLSPDEIQSAVKRLDSMMASWASRGIRIGYALPTGEDQSDPDDASGVTAGAVEAVASNLALRLGPSFGKAVPADVRIAARDAYNALLSAASPIPQTRMSPLLPYGAGNRSFGGRTRWINQSAIEAGNVPPDPLPVD